MASRSLTSLRIWLQSTSLLAVVAGYSALFAFGSSLAEAERLERHQQLVDQIRSGVNSGALALPLPPAFGVQAVLVPSGSPREITTFREQWFLLADKPQSIPFTG